MPKPDAFPAALVLACAAALQVASAAAQPARPAPASPPTVQASIAPTPPPAPTSPVATAAASNGVEASEAPAAAREMNTVGAPERSLAPPLTPAPKPEAAKGAPPPTDAALAADQGPLQALVQSANRLPAEEAKAKGDAALAKARQDAAAAQAAADGFARSRQAEIASVNQRLRRYSTPSGAPRPHLSAAEQRERADLLARRATLTGLLTTAEQAASQAGGVYNDVASRRRSAFSAQVFARTASPLEAGFWTSLIASLPPDTERLGRMLGDTADTALSAPEPRGLLSVLVALALAFGLAGPLRRALKRLINRRAADADAHAAAEGDPAAPGELYRSAHAVGVVLVDTLLPGAAAAVVNLGLTWGELVSDKAETLLKALVIAVFWGGAVVALGRQLAGAPNPRERLLSVSETLAARMRALPWLVALITGSGLLLRRINEVVGASVAATIAANCLVSLAYAAVASLALLALTLGRESDEELDEARRPMRALVSLALSAAILLTVGAVFAGFSTFAVLVSRQIFWISVLAGVTYLFLRFTDDVVAKLFAPQGWVGRTLTVVLSLRLATIRQLGVLTSALAQILILLAALTLALTPFGGNGEMLSIDVSQIGRSVHIGSLVISPRSVLTGLVSLLVGLGLVHLVQRWVNRRYLPVTDWDAGVQNSVSTGVRYLGVGLTILWALAAAGLGFKQIALVASALSVGIGFGLQQIVQNFVSGLILLVERPVKVGDWVNVGGVEGDVQRIRVRATEIRTFDKTTLIVPNSDLITKQVQNKTLGDPRGRVRLELSVGAAADAIRAKTMLVDLLAADEEVLDDPAPCVFIESLTTGGSVNFVCFAYVASARDTWGVRSRLYTEVLELFGREKIGFIGGPGTNIVEPGPQMKDFVTGLAKRMAKPPAPKGEAGPPAVPAG